MWAALLLGGLGATDWLDGWVARRFGQVSELGKILDPTADRLLLLVAMAWIFGVPGLVIAWWAAFGYLPVARRALAEARSSRA